MDDPYSLEFGVQVSKNLDAYTEDMRSIAPFPLVEATSNLSKGLSNPNLCRGEFRELMLAFAHELSEAVAQPEIKR